MTKTNHQVDKSINSLWYTVLKLGVGLLILLLAACNLQPKVPSESPRGELTPQFTGWLQLGGTLDTNIALPASAPSVAVDSVGNPTVAWVEDVDFNGRTAANLYVKHWTGSSWQSLGEFLLLYGQWGDKTSLKLDSSGKPIVAHSVYVKTIGFDIIARRWNGLSWQGLGNLGGDLAHLFDSPANFNPEFAFTIDSQDNPIIAVENYYTGDVYIAKWNGEKWSHMATEDHNYPKISLAVDANDIPIVAFTGNGKTYVKYVSNGTLVNLGTNPINIGTGQSGNVSLTGGAFPAVAWTEQRVSSPEGYHNLFVKQWNGSDWVSLGANGSNGFGLEIAGAANPSLATNFQGDLLLAYQEVDGLGGNDLWNVRRWNGSSWSYVGGVDRLDFNDPEGNAITPSLALSASGSPTIAWSEDGNVFTKQFLSNRFAAFGASLDATETDSSSNASIALNNLGNPVVALQEDTGATHLNDIFVRRWVGNSWDFLGSTLDVSASNNATNPSLATNSSGNAVIAWQEKVAASWDVYVKQWNGTSWSSVGTALDKSLARDAESPSLTLGSNNLPSLPGASLMASAMMFWLNVGMETPGSNLVEP